MKKQIKSGWHTVDGRKVYVDDQGHVTRGLSKHGWSTVYPYRACKDGGMDIDTYMTLDAFRAAWKRGTVTLL